MQIKSNHRWRDFLTRYDVPERILADQFSHLGTDAVDGFLKYRGWYYHISDFERMPILGLEWDGCSSDSLWTGVLIHLNSDGEQYKIGTYYCES